MFARELISDVIPPLRTSDSVQKVLDRMAEFRINHLPIVNDQQILGLISEDDLIEVQDLSIEIGGLSLSLHNYYVFEHQHIYDVIRLFAEQHLSVVPVLDQNKNYLGLISINNMVEYFAVMTSVKEPGGIIILEIDNRNNSLAHIAQIIESDNAQILSSYIKSFPDSTRLELTLKLNRTDISAIISSLLRYNYNVKATFNDIKADDGTQDRYDQLMNYLDI
ncbi:CBS domain-containing protein [Daejeonella oryzae]|uniref:CBS domain-containing protein n=1 Tax=Daejeonella oryzae TaxID=1122943 RepID=UPI0004172F91|nr:CBS domain-containing protein [Daejeonella oryzae]